jgi:hypothetical protein
LYSDLLADNPHLAETSKGHHRFKAARAADLIGCSQGVDAGNLIDAERARWRSQPVSWLTDELHALRKRLETASEESREPLTRYLEPWPANPYLAGIREPAEFVKLPTAVRQNCEKLWSDAATLIKKYTKPIWIPLPLSSQRPLLFGTS